MDFYVELFSNFDSELFSQNTISNFVTKLYTKFELAEDFTVGLSEISYPKTWYNVKKQFKIFCFDQYGQTYEPSIVIEESKDDELSDNYLDPRLKERSGNIYEGYYSRIELLISSINLQLVSFSRLKTYPKLIFDKATNKVIVVGGEIEGYDSQKNQYILKVFPYFGEEIDLMLGLKNSSGLGLYDYITREDMRNKRFVKHTFLKGWYESFRPVELNAGVDNLLVYCDLVYPQAVGDSSVKLLRTVEIPVVSCKSASGSESGGHRRAR